MSDIPEHLLRRSAEARAKALGVPVEQVLAEMKGEAPPPTEPEQPEPTEPEPAEPDQARPEPSAEAEPEPETAAKAEPEPEIGAEAEPEPALAAAEPVEPAVASDVSSLAAVVERPSVPARTGPEGVRTQRLLTVVRAKAIQQVKSEPADKVNVWPHLLLIEFAALMAVTALLVVMSVVLQAPLLETANFNSTPNPSKAPWYFLGLQELLSYFDPQIAGVMIPTVVGMAFFIAIPYVDRNPSNRPSDRKFAIFLFTLFLIGSATLTMLGVFFRGPGFNFTYPWADGIWFDDLKDWVNFE